MAILDEEFKKRNSADWLARLEAAGVPAGPIYRVDEVFDDPQVRHLGIAKPVRSTQGRDIKLVGQPVTLSRTPAEIVAPIPELGADTDKILADLGLFEEDIARLRRENVV
jgi:crotonobetainyl-CoA:carnitine CoA-transferase CaiB-like acyl-CoA transferase